MGRFTKLLGLACLTTSIAQAQLVENFDDPSVIAPATTATTWELPSGTWQIFDNGVGSINWSLNPQATYPAYSGEKAAFINRQNIGQNNTSVDYLATPLIQSPVNPQVRFFNRTSSAQDTGTIFHLKAAPGGADPSDPASYTVNLGTWNEGQVNPNYEEFNEIVVNITPAQQTQLGASFYIAFVKEYTQTGTAISGERWIVDDVRVISNCLAPENIQLTATHQQINANFTIGAAQIVWAHVVPAGADFDPLTTTATPIALTGAGPYALTQTTFPTEGPLSPVTEYEVYFLSECAFSQGEWTTPIAITTSSAPPVCGGNYVDNGGVSGNYLSNSEEIVTICPENPGDIVVVTFASFNVEESYDGLFVYNGDSILAPPISSGNGMGQLDAPGAYWGTTIPGPFESAPDGCLTFRFVSDGIVQYAGWVANIECMPAPTCPKPIDLTVTATFDTTVNVSWTAVDGAQSYELLALPCGTLPTANAQPQFTTTTTNFTFTGLAQLTCYDFYVRAICGDGEQSFWSIKATTTTQQTPPSCGDVFSDNGGENADYLPNSNYTLTICPDEPGDVVRVTFTSFAVETSYDGLYVYDGNSVNAPQIASTNGAGFGAATTPGAFWGTTIPGPFESSSPDGCLTFRFASDGFVQQGGWTANIECIPMPTCPRVTAITTSSITTTTVNVSWTPGLTETEWVVYAVSCDAAVPTYGQAGGVTVTGNPYVELTDLTPASCYMIYIFAVCSEDDQSSVQGPVSLNTQIAPPVCGGNMVDPGGLTANYNPNMNDIITICADAGEFVTVEFTAFNMEANYDGMYVFDGDTINAPMIPSTNPAGNNALNQAGAYWGTNIPGPFESTNANGCLTFQFISDGSVQYAGWVANIICAPIPTCPKPTALATPEIFHDSLMFTWTPIGEETQWMVFALPCNDPKPTSATPGGVIVDSTSHVFEGLDPMTCYKLYVIPLCSDEDHGPTAGPLTITTSIAPPVCGGLFVDDGGLQNYGNNSDYVITICPEEEGDMVAIVFSQFDIENNYDGLLVYNGNSVNAPQISSGNGAGFGLLSAFTGAFWGTTIPGPIFADNATGCLTFRFISDNVVNYTGWQADVICMPAPNCESPVNITMVEATEQGFEIGWTSPDASVSEWQVIVLPAASAHPMTLTEGWQTTTSNPYFYAMDMIPGQYAVYVRSVCADGTYSLWSTALTVNPFVVTGNSTQYTVEELVETVLLKSTCALVENITTNAVNSIGYFNSGLADFPFEDGVVITTGLANRIHGPNSSILGDDNLLPGDPELEAIIQAATGVNMDSENATMLEFDFTPISPNFKFRFMFASEEYGQYQCDYSDAFAFILTDLTEGSAPVNLAVVPGTATPISVVTVRNGLYYDGWEENCGSLNEDHFDRFWGGAYGLPNNEAPINYNGITVPFQIDHIVIPGHTYHIKLVIADRLDTNFDSAVFIEGNSLDIGNIELGEDFVAADGTAFCDGDSYELQTGLNPDEYTFEWTLNGVVLEGENGASYMVTQSGVYGVTATYLNSECTTSDSVTIEYYSNMNLQEIPDLLACDPTGFATFNLQEVIADLPDYIGEWDTFSTFHLTEEEANEGSNAITNLLEFTNSIQYNQFIYLRVENIDTGCIKVEPIEIIVNTAGPNITLDVTSYTVCEGESTAIVLQIDAAAVYTYKWYYEGEEIEDATGSAFTASQAGNYAVRVYDGVCYTESTFEVILVTPPVVELPTAACDSFTLPALPGSGAYYTQSGGQGEQLVAGTVLTSTQSVYVYEAGCSELVFTVTIIPTPVVTVVGGCLDNVYTLTATATPETNDAINWYREGSESVIATGATYTPQGPGIYYASTQNAANAETCIGLSAPFEVLSTQCTIQKGISADGDGINDYFDLAGYAVSKLRIYNRYGMVVYDKGNYSTEFVGKDNKGNELPVGTYYYVIELSNGAPSITGWIYIAR